MTSSPVANVSPRPESLRGRDSPSTQSPTPPNSANSPKQYCDNPINPLNPLNHGVILPSTIPKPPPFSSNDIMFLGAASAPGGKTSGGPLIQNRPSFGSLEEAMISSVNSTQRRSPLEMLCRVFPYAKRSVLQLILHDCNNDMVHAIEHILNSNNGLNGANGIASSLGTACNSVGGSDSVTSPITSLSSVTALGATMGPASVSTLASLTGSQQGPLTALPTPSFFPPTYIPPSVLSSPTFKSAFSPISAPPAAHLNSIRYSYGTAPNSRNNASGIAAAAAAALTLPYPPLLPSLAFNPSYGYNGLANANKALHYAMGCAYYPAKTYPSPTSEKATGCIQDLQP